MSFTANPAGLVELLNDPASLNVLDQWANAIADEAKTNTRRGSSPAMGHIADRYRTDRAKPTSEGGRAAVWNDSPVFHLEEFGSIHQPPQRPLTRAARKLTRFEE